MSKGVAKMINDLNETWNEYKNNNNQEARNDLIIHYAPLVKHVANRLIISLSPVAEVDELISYGIEGLINALDRFDLSRNVKFETYAITRIRGSMIDGLRYMDWVPVSVRQKSKKVETAYANLETKLGRSATDEEVAQEMGVELEELQSLLKDITVTSLVCLDDFVATGHKTRFIDLLKDEKEDIFSSIVFEENKKMLAESIEKLPEREKKVIYLYYYEGLNLKEIGQVLGLTESRISQLHTKAIHRLRGHLHKDSFN